MAMHAHLLRGSTPTPLARYLKALGILRLVAEQVDPTARGAWRPDGFVLLTSLDRLALEAFLLNDYRPTPLLSPWLKSSGFYSEKDKGLYPIEQSQAARLQAYRDGIKNARELLKESQDADAAIRSIKEVANQLKSAAEKDALRSSDDYKRRLARAEKEFKTRKEGLIPKCRLVWRGQLREWLDVAVTLTGDNKAQYQALLGTGGNDGHLDFTNNFMQRLGELFDLAAPAAPARPESVELLSSALWDEPSRHLQDCAIGMFHPGGAGGANSTAGPSGNSQVNSWDYVLMLEGTLLFSARATRKLATDAVKASAPFALRSQATGYAGASVEEEGARGEQWMPLWSRALSLEEVQALFSEGRVQVGERSAQRPLEAARSIARLGVARGLTGFERYGYLERNGQSTLAVPLGRLAVKAHPRALLMDDLAPWLDRLQREARGRGAPSRLVQAERRLSDALFAALTHDDAPARWQTVLRAAAGVESLQVTGSGVGAGPIPPLSVDWIEACDDGSPLFRLALSLAGARVPRSQPSGGWESVRVHWLPLEAEGRYAVQGQRLRQEPRIVCQGRDAVSDCLALVLRRLTEASSGSARRLDLLPSRLTGARPSDLAAFISGELDLEALLSLARAFMALRWGEWAARARPLARQARGLSLDDSFVALRLCFLAQDLEDQPIPADARIVRRLQAGDGARALEGVLQRLRAAAPQRHTVPPLHAATVDPARARRMGAALAFPIDDLTATQMARTLFNHSMEEI